MNNLIVLDCESYPNYFLAAFKNIDDGRVVTIEARGAEKSLEPDQIKKLNTIMKKRTTFGFNSNKYDIPMILFALKGKTCRELNKLSDYIILKNTPQWQTLKHFDLYQPEAMSHFDICEPAPGVMVSLKLYGGRLNSEKLQDLPIEPGTTLTEEEMDGILTYCINDLDTTIDLFDAVKPLINLRYDMSEQYGQDLRSKSDAQIAEALIKHLLTNKSSRKTIKRPIIKSSTTFKYEAPAYIKFKGEQLSSALDLILNETFELDKKGSIKLPKELRAMKIILGKSKYQLGIGGIHSTEKAQAIIPKKNELLCDRDVASYYPNIMLNLGLSPKHLGTGFLDIYQNIIIERLEAKRTGNKVVNQSLKIVLNGTFGKLGSQYSILYAPDLMLAVTLTGQLALLMLIEALEIAGISVISANTDGFVSIMDKSQHELYDDICFQWELDTAFELEETRYEALYSRDINNYLAFTTKGPKGKGIFSTDRIKKNPAANICITAVVAYLENNHPVNETIKECKDITQFVTVRTANGGAVWRGQFLGRVVRWIYSTDGEKITYKKNGNKVPKSDGSRPLMILDGMVDDLDYDRYIEEALSILKDIGHE